MTQTRIHIEQKGSGKHIVMLHGWGVNSHIFAPLFPILADYSVHYVDLPGFGESDAIAGGIDDWLDAMIEQLPESATWIGWSLGGLVATRAAVRHPERVSGLATITSSPYFVAQGANRWPGIAPRVLNQFFDQLGQDPQITIERFLAIQAIGSEHAKLDIKRIKQLVLNKPMPNSCALVQGLRLLQTVDLRNELPQISQPWLRFWGAKDSLVPLQLLEQMPITPQSQDVVFDKASHAPFISHSEQFSDVLLNWLQTHG